MDVVRIAGKRLKEIKKYESAAAVFESVSLFDEAIRCYVMGLNFDRAKECNAQIKNKDVPPFLRGSRESPLFIGCRSAVVGGCRWRWLLLLLPDSPLV